MQMWRYSIFMSDIQTSYGYATRVYRVSGRVVRSCDAPHLLVLDLIQLMGLIWAVLSGRVLKLNDAVTG